MPKPKKALDAGRVPDAKAGKLTPKEEAFCQNYLIHRNGTKSAQLAGYGGSNDVLRSIASENLAKRHIKARLAELGAPVLKKQGITRQRILDELAYMGFARLSDIVAVERGQVKVTDTEKWGKQHRVAVSEITETLNESGSTIKVKMHDKISALKELAKYVGLSEGDPGDNQAAAEQEQTAVHGRLQKAFGE